MDYKGAGAGDKKKRRVKHSTRAFQMVLKAQKGSGEPAFSMAGVRRLAKDMLRSRAQERIEFENAIAGRGRMTEEQERELDAIMVSKETVYLVRDIAETIAIRLFDFARRHAVSGRPASFFKSGGAKVKGTKEWVAKQLAALPPDKAAKADAISDTLVYRTIRQVRVMPRDVAFAASEKVPGIDVEALPVSE